MLYQRKTKRNVPLHVVLHHLSLRVLLLAAAGLVPLVPLPTLLVIIVIPIPFLALQRILFLLRRLLLPLRPRRPVLLPPIPKHAPLHKRVHVHLLNRHGPTTAALLPLVGLLLLAVRPVALIYVCAQCDVCVNTT